VLGIGREPHVPGAVPYLGDTTFHGSEHLQRDFPRVRKRVVVVGGGQTAPRSCASCSPTIGCMAPLNVGRVTSALYLLPALSIAIAFLALGELPSLLGGSAPTLDGRRGRCGLRRSKGPI